MRHLPYGLGVAIPCAIIIFIGSGVYFYFLPKLSEVHGPFWLGGYGLVWLSYLMAIFKSPGHPPRRKMHKFDVWCAKCEAPKPERAHHCKVCKRCVLKMDHHCPWTANCVGHGNLPHFFRFVFWVTAECIYSFYLEILFVKQMWNEPAYLYTTTEITLGVVELFVTLAIIVTVGILLLRVIYNTSNGQTQIEDWEQDRAAAMARRKIAPRASFPFDIDFTTNFYVGLGPIWLWFWPFSTAPGDGEEFPKLFSTDKRWPPNMQSGERHANHDFYRPENYINMEGEDLEFFGVDAAVDSRHDDEDIPLAALN